MSPESSFASLRSIESQRDFFSAATTLFDTRSVEVNRWTALNVKLRCRFGANNENRYMYTSFPHFLSKFNVQELENEVNFRLLADL